MGVFTFKVDDMDKLLKSLKRLGNVPQKYVTASAKKGMNIVLRQAKSDAPKDTGALKSGIISVGEKSKFKGKKIYRIVFSKHMNKVFQKEVKDPGSRGSPHPKKIAYYPVSQEYGWFAGNGNYIPGLYFGSKALEDKKPEVEKTIIQTMKKKVDEEIAKGGLK